MDDCYFQIREEKVASTTMPVNKCIKAVHRVTFDPEKVYIITGGLGGFGLELTDWMLSRHAHHVILTSRSGVRNGYQARKMKQWKTLGVNVTVSKMNVAKESEAEALISTAAKIGPVGGIFHLAMVKFSLFLIS